MRLTREVACAALLAGSGAPAESGELNVHLEPGVGAFVAPPQNQYFGAGPSLSIRADYPVWSALAVQLSLNGVAFPATPARFDQPARVFSAGAGLRARLADDDAGYRWHRGDQPGHRGNLFGNLWADASVHLTGTGPLVRFGYDLGLGCELSFFDDLQVGPFVRFGQIVQPNISGFDPNSASMLIGGLSVSVGLPTTSVHVDSREVEAPPIGGVPDSEASTRETGHGLPPDVPEVYKGDSGEDLVVLTRDRIIIKQPLGFEKVQFGSAAYEVSHSSYLVLATVAKVLALHPEIRKVRIEGHTDNQGGRDYNLELSHKRAEAVRKHLLGLNGVEPGRLEAEGFGFERPVADNDDPDGRAKNRRVEFHIIDRVDTSESTTVIPKGAR